MDSRKRDPPPPFPLSCLSPPFLKQKRVHNFPIPPFFSPNNMRTKQNKWLCTVWKRFPLQFPYWNERLRSVLSIALYSPPVINTIGLADSLSGLITQGRRGHPSPLSKVGHKWVFAPPPHTHTHTFGQNNCSTCNFTICSQFVVKTFFFPKFSLLVSLVNLSILIFSQINELRTQEDFFISVFNCLRILTYRYPVTYKLYGFW